MHDKLRLYRIVVLSLCGCAGGITVLVWSTVPLAENPWPGVVHFAVLTGLMELLAISVQEGEGVEVSPASPILWAATCVLGPFPAVVVSCVSAAFSALARCACYHLAQAWDTRTTPGSLSLIGELVYRAIKSVGSLWQARRPGVTALFVASYTASFVLEVAPAGLVYNLIGGHFLIDVGDDFDVLPNFVLPFFGLVAASSLVHLGEYPLIAGSADPVPGVRGIYGVLLRMKLTVIETALPLVKGQMFLWVVALLLAYLYSQIGILGFVLAITPVLALRGFFYQWVEERNAYLNTITTLATYMQHYHPYTRGHLKRVADMSERLARELRLPVESIRHMNAAGFLHDIGKIGVSEEILDKPSQLTDEEWARIKEHPVKGAEIISHLEFLEGIVDWIRFHHKWHDGRGYPDVDGQAARIPIEAAIIATADAFDAMTDDRELTIEWNCDSCGHKPEDGERPSLCPRCGAEKRRRYREPRPLDDAVEELRRGAGTQFHPKVVKAFLSMVERDGIKLNV